MTEMQMKTPSREGGEERCLEYIAPTQNILELIQMTFQSQTVAEHVIEKMLKRTHNKLYSKAVDEKLSQFAITDTFNQMVEVISQTFKYHEEEESALIFRENEETDQTLILHDWSESTEPNPTKYDTCARGKIGVEVRDSPPNFTLPISPLSTTPNLTGEGFYKKSGPKSHLSSYRKKIPKQPKDSHIKMVKPPEAISLIDGMDEIEHDDEIRFLRAKAIKKDIDIEWAKKLEKDKLKMEKAVKEEMRKTLDMLTKTNYTFSYEGRPIKVQIVPGEKLPEVHKRCFYSFADEPKEKRKIKLSRGNLGISTGFKNSLKTPAKEKDFVKAIILGAGSNYNYMDPTFEGITIKEEGKQKTGELSYGAQFGELKVSKQDYDQKVRAMNSLFLETATSRLDSTYERDHHSTMNPTIVIDPSIVKETEGSESYTPSEINYKSPHPLKADKIMYKENYNIQELITNTSIFKEGQYAERLGYPKSYIPQIPKQGRDIKTLRKIAPGSQSHSAFALPAPRGPTDKELLNLQVENPVDIFNRQLLSNADWGINTQTLSRRSMSNKFKPFNKPQFKDIIRSVPSVKKLPRERNYIEKNSNKFRLPPPRLGMSYGHGIV